jgi:hypothetical protein
VAVGPQKLPRHLIAASLTGYGSCEPPFCRARTLATARSHAFRDAAGFLGAGGEAEECEGAAGACMGPAGSGRPAADARSLRAASLRRSFSTTSAQGELLAASDAWLGSVCLLRSVSDTFAKALGATTRFIWSLLAGGSGWVTMAGKPATGSLGWLDTSRRAICGQAEHLNVRRSNPGTEVSAWLTSIRSISAPHAKHFITRHSPKRAHRSAEPARAVKYRTRQNSSTRFHRCGCMGAIAARRASLIQRELEAAARGSSGAVVAPGAKFDPAVHDPEIKPMDEAAVAALLAKNSSCAAASTLRMK